MRDHLSRLAQIQEALGDGEYDKAADIAEKHLGMSSLQMHGAHEVSKYMPKGMQELGSSMHRSAGQSAIAEAYRINGPFANVSNGSEAAIVHACIHLLIEKSMRTKC